MRGGPAPSAAAAAVADLYRAPLSSRSDVFLPGTAGDFSLSASLSACTLLYEVPPRTGPGTASERAGGGQTPARRPPGPAPAQQGPLAVLPRSAAWSRQVPPLRPQVTPAHLQMCGLPIQRQDSPPHCCPSCSGRPRLEVATVFSPWLGRSCLGSVAETCRDTRGSLGSHPPMFAFPLQRCSLKIGGGFLL